MSFWLAARNGSLVSQALGYPDGDISDAKGARGALAQLKSQAEQ